MNAELKAALTLVERRGIAPLRRVGTFRTGSDWTRFVARRDEVEGQVCATLEAAGARISRDWQGAQIRMRGLTARSTSCLLGALQNWRKQAEAKLQKESNRVRP
jgi:hypothetical protein